MINGSLIGGFGRLGNSISQYVGLKHYCKEHGYQLCVPQNWEGRELFSSITEPNIVAELPFVTEGELVGQDNVSLKDSYFQDSRWVCQWSRSQIKEWLVPRRTVKGPKIAIHQRRGDYKDLGHYAVVSDKSYVDAFKEFGYSMSNAKIYSDDIGGDPHQDFLEIMNAEVIFRANSTYSWWAATLSNAKVYSPVVNDLGGWRDVPFVEGNHPRLCYMFGDLHIKE